MDFGGNNLKLFRIISVMIIQKNANRITLSYSSNYIQSKGIGNKKYYEETRELEK